MFCIPRTATDLKLKQSHALQVDWVQIVMLCPAANGPVKFSFAFCQQGTVNPRLEERTATNARMLRYRGETGTVPDVVTSKYSQKISLMILYFVRCMLRCYTFRSLRTGWLSYQVSRNAESTENVFERLFVFKILLSEISKHNSLKALKSIEIRVIKYSMLFTC